ncbi:MAG: 3-phosphoshikimate 1-carboxyvinyltransferase [Chloroflexia bacterium]
MRDEDGVARLRVFGRAQRLAGSISVPGDKSISHRAALLGAIAEGTTRISGFLPSNDCLATLGVVRSLGIEVAGPSPSTGEVVISGRGATGLREADEAPFCGGSGTTMRLAAGLLAGQRFYSILDGNEQLRRRPMGRVTEPLRRMGARIFGRRGGTLAPLTIVGGDLHGIDYIMPIASAQIKSALLLAGLFAEGATTVREAAPSRDHTERMLAAMGARIDRSMPGTVSVSRSALSALSLTVPGDISSAAFILASGAAVVGSEIRIEGVGVNYTRTGVVDVLRAMGVLIREENRREEHGEPVADLIVESRRLCAAQIAGPLVPRLIDELPVLAVVATQAEGVTEVRDAAELRVKETDRIATVVEELGKMGAHIEALPDGFRVYGPTVLRAAVVESHGDHRLAMALAVAGLLADGETLIRDTSCIADSYPGFSEALVALGAQVEETDGR